MITKEIKHGLILVVMFFSFINIAHASILFSEIAWMGTSDSSSNEWIELYNNSESPVDLSGWLIKTGDNDISIPLSGSIRSNSYYLIERTDDTTVPSVTADLVASFGHGLSNSGETLILKNSSADVQTIYSNSGWLAGDSSTKDTMQWDGSKWISAYPTPKDGNIVISNTDNTSNSDNTTPSTSTTSESKDEPKVYAIATKIVAPKIVTAGVPFEIDHNTTGLNKEKIILGKFIWNFGDGRQKQLSSSDSFSYVYDYPGEYVITLSYSDSNFDTKPDATDRLTIKVVPSGVVISSVGNYTDPFVELENKSGYEMSISGWILKGSVHSFMIPEGTVILANKKLKLSPKITGFDFNDLSSISVIDIMGQVFASYPNYTKLVIKYSSSNTPQENIVKSDIVENNQVENTDNVINLNDLGASTGNIDSGLNNKTLIYLGLIGIIIIGAFGIFLLRRKTEIPDYIDNEITADNMKIIE